MLKGCEFVRAACGRRLRVIYLYPFDTAEVGVCSKCASMADLWGTDPDEYERRVRVLNERWAQRDASRFDEFDADYFERQEFYGTDPIDYEEDVLP